MLPIATRLCFSCRHGYASAMVRNMFTQKETFSQTNVILKSFNIVLYTAGTFHDFS